MNRLVWLLAAFLFALGVGAGCSSDQTPKDLRLLGSAPKPPPKPSDEETERLRKMQLVTVVETVTNQDGTTTQIEEEKSVGDIDLAIRDPNSGLCQCPVQHLYFPELIIPVDPCFNELCERLTDACVAKLMLSMALPQTSEFKVGPFTIGTQSAGANAALAVHAVDVAQKGASLLKISTDLMLNVPTDDDTKAIDDTTNAHFVCKGPDANGNGDAETPFANQQVTKIEFATSAFGELYNTEKDATDVATSSILAVADSQLGSSASFDDALARVLAGSALSRVAAAHLLVGGDVGIQGDTTRTFCKDRIAPDLKAAVAVFRDAAVSPAVLANDALEIGTLLDGMGGNADGTGADSPGGSVRQRLGQFYGYTDLLSGRGIEDHFGLDVSTFQRARKYLNDENFAFGRSSGALLPPRTLPSGDPSSYPRFAGTASPPDYPPVGLYGATTRFAAFHDPPIAHVWPEDFQNVTIVQNIVPRLHYDVNTSEDTGMQPHAHFVDAALSQAGQWISALSIVTSDTVRRKALAPLVMLENTGDRLGRLTVTGFTTRTTLLLVDGFRADAGLLLAAGDDALRCAVNGNIEGADCFLDTSNGKTVPAGAKNPQPVLRINQPDTPHIGFSDATSLLINADSIPSGRIYLLKPKQGTLPPGDNAPPPPGNYDAILAFTRDPMTANAFFNQGAFPITPQLDQRIDDILAPSKKWCAMPRIPCSGGSFDQRLPLDDELADDQPSIESSWKHYLTLAQQAAQRADELGTDYINSGLQASQRAEDISIRTEQQLERAEEEIQKLQSICGTTVDPRVLLKALSGDAATGVVPSCDTTHPCTCSRTADCKTNAQSGFQCVSGQCVVDLKAFADAHRSDPDMQRIADCLLGAPADAFISLGDKPVCLWHDINNPHLLCEDEKGAQLEAGVRCPVVNADLQSCDTVLKTSTLSPALLAQIKVEETRPLSFFQTTTDDPPDAKRCDSLALIRNDSTRFANHIDEVVARNWFGKIASIGNHLSYTRTFDPAGQGTGLPSYAHVFAGDNNYETGSTETGPSGHWPCAQRDPSECALCNDSGPDNGMPKPCSLFCRQLNCADPGQRENANQLLQRAVAAGQLIIALDPNNPTRLSPQAIAIPVTEVNSKQFSIDGQCRTITGNNSACQRNNPNCGECVNGWSNETPINTPTGKIHQYSDKNGSVFYSTQVVDQMHTPITAIQFLPSLSGIVLGSSSLGASPAVPLANDPSPSGVWIQNALQGVDGHAQIVLNTGVNTLIPTGSVTISGDDLLNGYELLCDALPGPGGITLTNPPRVRSADDLASVTVYLDLLAKQIRNHISLAVFTNVPQSAEDNLKDQSAIGSYPKFGGQYGEQLSKLGDALLRIRESGPTLANEIEQFGNDVDHLRNVLLLNELDSQLADLQLASTITQQLSNCAGSFSVTNFGTGAVAACANMIAQINFATGIAELQKQKTELASSIAVGDFGATFSTRATNLQTLALHLAEAQNDFNAALSEIENLRNAALSSLSRSVYLASFQAAQQAEITSVIGSLFDGKQRRYLDALENAKRVSFLAKRAIEQRLGIHLAELKQDLPLVDAPFKWENSVCTFTGLDFATLKSANPDSFRNFTDGFISDYVTKLSNVVESYRLENSFHEGSDTAVISLRDDLMNVRANCEVPTGNLLFHAADLQDTDQPGWAHDGCPTVTVNGITSPVPDCVAIQKLEGVAPPFTDPNLVQGVQAFNLTFTSGTDPDAGTPLDPAVVQGLDLVAGRYRFSWYTQQVPPLGTDGQPIRSGGAAAETLRSDAGIQFTTFVSLAAGAGWDREFREFVLPSAARVRLGFHTPSAGAAMVTVAAPMLELLPGTKVVTDGGAVQAQSFAPLPFVNTSDKLTATRPACEDTSGAVFRATQWTRRCQRLCPDGFSNDCGAERAKTYCFREASFSINQRDIQAGKIVNFSGFARGNFNYRIDSIGINFVGTGTHDCDNTQLPSTCFGAAFIPYTLEHNGPFYVRNTLGDDVEALLFDGKIEHARGLASERYLTNPLSSADQTLINQYMRQELIGRPLDGNFVMRVWEDPGVNFDAISDVQLVLKYGYWTKFQ